MTLFQERRYNTSYSSLSGGPQTTLIIDLHVHTVKGGPDSNLSPEQLVAEARRVGLDGVCLSEHGGGWDRSEFDRFAEKHPDVTLLRGLEVDTELGHIVTFGLPGYISGIHRIDNLRKAIDDVNGFMIAVHPFRRFFDKPPLFKSLLFKQPVPLDEAVKHRIFELTDAVEVVNGACTQKENEHALRTARILDMTHTGGSDAHSTHGMGCGATVFNADIRTVQDLIEELRSGRYHATDGLLQGHREPFHLLEEAKEPQASA